MLELAGAGRPAQSPETASVRLVPVCASASALARGVPALDPAASASFAVAVGQSRAAPPRLGRFRPGNRPPELLPYCVAVAVGHEPCSESSVRRTNVVSTNHKRDCGVTRTFQAAQDLVACGSPNASHVLHKYEARIESADDPEHIRPEVTMVVASSSTASLRMGLAGEASRDNVNSGKSRG